MKRPNILFLMTDQHRPDVTGYEGNDRRFLTLWYSLDALNWFPAGCVARGARRSANASCIRP